MTEEITALLYALGIYLIFFAVAVINYGTFAVTVTRWIKRPDMSTRSKKIKQPPMTLKEKVPCYIPIYQALKVHKAFSERSWGVFDILVYFSIAGIIVNLVNKLLLPINGYVMLGCNIWMILSVFFVMITYGIVTMLCARMYDFSWFNCLLCLLFPVLWCWYLNNNIPDKMREAYKEEVFSEHTQSVSIR